MKQTIIGNTILFLFASCKNEKKPIVSAVFIDSLISHYSQPEINTTNETDLQFWKNRLDPKNPGLVSELKYAAALIQRVHLSGDINDVITADSILYVADKTFNHKESSPNMALVRNSMLQHRFTQADSLFDEAKKTDVKPYDAISTSFDVDFELGRYQFAEAALQKITDYKDYGFNFRLAKLAHYQGKLDSSIAAMQRASIIAGNDIYLKQAALSNEADLNLHSGNLQRANDLYMESIRLSAADLHSVMGLGWIALVHDKNESLAEKIFLLVRSKTKSPDGDYKLVQLADARGDSVLQMKYAGEFASIVSEPVYGNMYNKYLIELYTGILNDPARAEKIAERELLNRATAQTYAWYTWTLFKNNKVAEAGKLYQQHVSGKPLEGLELYWMGKFMQGQSRIYNAKQFFKAAYKNSYDLSPGMISDLKDALEE